MTAPFYVTSYNKLSSLGQSSRNLLKDYNWHSMNIVVLQPKFSAIIGLQKKKRQLNDSSSPLSEGAKLHVNLTAWMQLKRKKPCQIVHGVTLSLLLKTWLPHDRDVAKSETCTLSNECRFDKALRNMQVIILPLAWFRPTQNAPHSRPGTHCFMEELHKAFQYGRRHVKCYESRLYATISKLLYCFGVKVFVFYESQA